jgi:hypothetical protein
LQEGVFLLEARKVSKALDWAESGSVYVRQRSKGSQGCDSLCGRPCRSGPVFMEIDACAESGYVLSKFFKSTAGAVFDDFADF